MSVPTLTLEVHKFGGSSVATPESISKIRKILVERLKRFPASDRCPMAVVVSAMGKTTDGLIALIELAKAKKDYSEPLAKLCRTQTVVVEELIPQAAKAAVMANVEKMFDELKVLLQGVSTLEEASDRTRARIMSFGERMSAYIISEVMKTEIPESDFLDARSLVKTDGSYLSGIVDFKETDANIQAHFAANPKKFYIMTGFIGTLIGSEGLKETTLLGRGGSDYTASIFGAALRSKVVVIWTDVDGVMTADPRMVGDKVIRVPNLSFEEAMELSFFGAKVIYAPTMGPAIKYQIPLHIKSTFEPDGFGTIVGKGPIKDDMVIRGITSITNIALLLLEGCGMVGVTGVAARLFTALTRVKVNAILITQASSEHSICVAVELAGGDAGQKALLEEFEVDIRRGLIDGVKLQKDCTIVAVVGDGMIETPGVMGKIGAALGRNMISIMCIAQGSSERNISLVVKRSDEKKALNVIHDAFFGKKDLKVNVFLVGSGRVGSRLLKALHQRGDHLREHGMTVELNGICNSKKMLLDLKGGIALDAWEARLNKEGEATSLAAFAAKMKCTDYAHAVLIDCTSQPDTPSVLYQAALSQQITVLTCNNRSTECTYELYKKLEQLSSRAEGPRWHCRAIVDPSMPVVQTIKNVISGGDKVNKITASFSGALTTIFQRLSASQPFSAVAKAVCDQGLHERAPEIALSARDLVCRMLVLARVCGWELEFPGVKCENFLPSQWKAGQNVFPMLTSFDKSIEEKRAQAEKKGAALRYVGEIDFVTKKVTIGPQEVPASHPCASSVEGTVVILVTNRSAQPIVMQSPPAYAEEVAMGLFSDLCALAGNI